MTETVRETKRADELKPGDWTIWLGSQREFDGLDRAEVLFAHPYTDEVGTPKVYVVAAEMGYSGPQGARIRAADKVQMLTEDEVRRAREEADRTRRIADIRALADWLEANPEIPMAYGIGGQADLSESQSYSAAEIDAVRAFAEKHGGEFRKGKDHTSARIRFGGVTYSLITWHKDGRPADPAPEPADPTGLAYSRADDEPDDPTPVSGARVAPHVGAVTEQGLVDVTPDPDHACAAHDDAHLGQPCPDLTLAPAVHPDWAKHERGCGGGRQCRCDV